MSSSYRNMKQLCHIPITIDIIENTEEKNAHLDGAFPFSGPRRELEARPPRGAFYSQANWPRVAGEPGTVAPATRFPSASISG